MSSWQEKVALEVTGRETIGIPMRSEVAKKTRRMRILDNAL